MASTKEILAAILAGQQELMSRVEALEGSDTGVEVVADSKPQPVKVKAKAGKVAARRRGSAAKTVTGNYGIGATFTYKAKNGKLTAHCVTAIEGEYALTDQGQRFKVATLPKLEKKGIVTR